MAKSPRKHHFVPRFLLARWADSKNKVTYFQWHADAVLRPGRCGPRGVGFEEHLYSQRDATGVLDPAIEKEFFAPVIDDPGALVLDKLRPGAIHRLTDADRRTWSRFLVAQLIRVPSMVQYVKEKGRQLMLNDIDSVELPGAIQAKLGSLTLTQYLEADAGWVLDNASLRALEAIIGSAVLNSVFLDATWDVIDVKASNLDLVIGDRPLLLEGRMSEQYLFMLPLSPTCAFVATNESAVLRKLSGDKVRDVVAAFNKESTSVASTYVYATGQHHERMIERYLRKSIDPDDRHIVSGLKAALCD